jgi:hypothetical protein
LAELILLLHWSLLGDEGLNMSIPVTIQDKPDRRSAEPSQGVGQLQLGLKAAVRAFAKMSPVDPEAKIELMLFVERQFNWLPTGTVVAVNYEDGTFITGDDRIEVMQRCATEFGQGAGGQLFEVGQPVGVGGWRR